MVPNSKIGKKGVIFYCFNCVNICGDSFLLFIFADYYFKATNWFYHKIHVETNIK